MKSIILFCSALILIIAGCSKDKTTENNGLIGKWKLKEEYWSIGDNTIRWTPVEESKQSVIEFHADGSFTFSANFQKADLQLNRFVLAGSEVNMSSTLNSNTDTWYISYSDNKRLEISIFRCFEGCSYKFVAIK